MLLIHISMYTCIHPYMHLTCICTSIHHKSCIHPCIHTYIHTCIHTLITYTPTCNIIVVFDCSSCVSNCCECIGRHKSSGVFYDWDWTDSRRLGPGVARRPWCLYCAEGLRRSRRSYPQKLVLSTTIYAVGFTEIIRGWIGCSIV